MTSPLSPPEPDAARAKWGAKLASGAFWMIALRWAIRLTGLVSTVFLARLLTPGDFGIVAMAMIVVGTLEMFNLTGQKLVLIRLENPTEDHFNSAWTVSFLIGLAIALVILAVAPFTEFYFHEPRVVPVMQCLALRAVLGGLENIGTVHFRRDLRFDQFFAYNVVPKLISFFITIGLAFALRNYWALVAGMLSGQLTLIVLSYTMHAHRPWFNFSRIREIWSFSIWAFFRSIGSYLNTQIDQIIVGGIGGSSLMGRYAVATDVAQSPAREVNEPMVAVIYPVMSRLQDNVQELRNVYLHTLAWSAVICASAGVGVALVAPGMQALLLGAKWNGIGPLMGWLAISVAITGLSSGTYSLFDTVGKPHLGARLIWVRLIILAALIVPVAFWTHNILDVAICRTVGEALFMPGLLAAAGSIVQVGWRDYLRVLYRPYISAAVMAATVLLVNYIVPLPSIAALVLDAVVGAIVFCAAAWVLWVAAARPAGPERDVFGHMARLANLGAARAAASRS
jgi:O-antigen/teichoic acid export membrane protein